MTNVHDYEKNLLQGIDSECTENFEIIQII